MAAVRRLGRGTFNAAGHAGAAVLAELPSHLDRIDRLIATGVLDRDDPTAADYMIATSLALFTYHDDLARELGQRPARELLDRVLPASG
jgi:glutathione S-transferase